MGSSRSKRSTRVVRIPTDVANRVEAMRKKQEGGGGAVALIAALGLGAFIGFLLGAVLSSSSEKKQASCPVCGKSVHWGHVACSNCGTKLVWGPIPA